LENECKRDQSNQSKQRRDDLRFKELYDKGGELALHQ